MSLGLATALALGGGALLALLFLMQERLAFHPSPVVEFTPAALGLEFQERRMEASDGTALAGWWVPAGPRAPSLLFLHGNAGNISHRLEHLRRLHQAGLSVHIVDYRGYGLSQGHPSEEGIFLDARAAWEDLTGDLGRDPATVLIYGESIGSAPALRLAVELGSGPGSPAGLVLEGAFTSALEMARRSFPFLPVSWILRLRMDNLGAVRRLDRPVLFIHGSRDEIVPVRMGRRLFEAASHPGKELLEVPGAGHNSVWMGGGEQVAGRIAAFARKVIREP